MAVGWGVRVGVAATGVAIGAVVALGAAVPAVALPSVSASCPQAESVSSRISARALAYQGISRAVIRNIFTISCSPSPWLAVPDSASRWDGLQTFTASALRWKGAECAGLLTRLLRIRGPLVDAY